MKLARTITYNPAFFTVVPLIHVLLLPFVFFSLGSTFVLQPGLAVNLPLSSYSLAPQQNPEVVSIISGAVPTLYHRDERVTLDQFKKNLSVVVARERSLIIKADRGTPYALVVEVMNEALSQGFSVVLATAEPGR